MRRVPLPVLPAWLRWAGVALVAAVIFYLSVVTVPPESPVVDPPSAIPLDKWRHFLAYAALAGALAYATVDWDRPGWQLVVAVVGVAALYGIGIEAIQATVPQRYFSLGDAWANVIGAVLVLPWFALRSRVRLRHVGGRRPEG
jgi:VanZ family protein